MTSRCPQWKPPPTSTNTGVQPRNIQKHDLCEMTHVYTTPCTQRPSIALLHAQQRLKHLTLNTNSICNGGGGRLYAVSVARSGRFSLGRLFFSYTAGGQTRGHSPAEQTTTTSAAHSLSEKKETKTARYVE